MLGLRLLLAAYLGSCFSSLIALSEARAQTLTPQNVPLLSGPTIQAASEQLIDGLSQPFGGAGVSIKAFVAETDKAKAQAEAKDIPLMTADLVRALRDDPTAIVTQVRLAGEHFDLVKAAADNPKPNRTAQHAMLASLALDRSSKEKLLHTLSDADSAAALRVRSDLEEARRLLGIYTGDQWSAALLAQGSVRGAAAGDSAEGSAGAGSVGLNMTKGDWTVSGLITVASSVDTLRSGFGAFLLTPASGKGSLSTALVDIYTPRIPRPWRWIPRGLMPSLHAYAAGANSTWGIRDLADTTTFVFKQAAVLAWGALGNWQIVRGRLLNVPLQVNVETGYSYRYLKGDVFADTLFIKRALYAPSATKFDRSWGAWETGFQMRIGAVSAGVQYYWVNGHEDREFITGLTNGQLVIGIAVSGDVVSGVLVQ